MNLDKDFDNHKYMDIKNEAGENVSEQKLHDALNKINLYPKAQYKIDKIRVDFAFPEYKLVIEVDGKYHDSLEQQEKDKRRRLFLDIEGWNIKVFRANEVYNNPEDCALVIQSLLKKLDYIPPKNNIEGEYITHLNKSEIDEYSKGYNEFLKVREEYSNKEIKNSSSSLWMIFFAGLFLIIGIRIIYNLFSNLINNFSLERLILGLVLIIIGIIFYTNRK